MSFLIEKIVICLFGKQMMWCGYTLLWLLFTYDLETLDLIKACYSVRVTKNISRQAIVEDNVVMFLS